MQKRVLIVAIAFSLIVTAAFAHGGKSHKAMGTVTSIDVEHITIKDTHGKTVKIPMDSKTMFMNGKAMAKLSDVKPGMRVVVETTEAGSAEHVKFTTKKAR